VSAALAEPCDAPGAPCEERPQLRAVGGGPTLAEVMAGVWEGLSARRPVACPVCAGAMRPPAGERAGGRCGSCAAVLT
jgi:hypothetical protein